MLSRNQFRPVEFSRAGKPKKAYDSRAAAQAVADLHREKYGTVAQPYIGKDQRWYVATDRRATADERNSARLRDKEELRRSLSEPIMASDTQTRIEHQVGTGASVMHRLAASTPENPGYINVLNRWNPSGQSSLLNRR